MAETIIDFVIAATFWLLGFVAGRNYEKKESDNV